MVTSIEQRYIDLHPKCAEQFATSRDIFPNGVTHDARNLTPFPYYVTHAEGPHKFDLDGQRLIDYRTGHGALLLGHSHPDIVAAVSGQMTRGTHYAASTEMEILWARWVQELVPCSEKVRFHSSGTEATMMAFRMARSYTGKSKIIKFQNHFHGWHDYAVVGGPGIGGIPEETASTMIVLPAGDISVVEKTLQDNDDVAAIVLEPTGAHMGQDAFEPSFLSELREITGEFGVVLIFDEVVTGFRTSRGGAQGHYGVTPDMSTHAKILGGGLPGGAVTGKAEIIDMIQLSDDTEFNRTRRVGHNGTFNANPLSAAAGIKALQLVAETDVNDKADAMGARLKEGLNDLLSRMEVPGCASGVSSLIFLRLGVDHECDKEVCVLTPEQRQVEQDAERNHQLGLALYNRGVDAGSGRFILSATHTEDDIDETVETMGEALTEVRGLGLV
jgi:glutamate-1-semialdehyde 2,1-aminomutase